MEIEKLLRPNIRRLKPYSSARDEYELDVMVKLDANESPFGEGLNRYPDPYQLDLKQAIAAHKGLSATNLVLGNGSDELIDLVIRAFCEPGVDNVVSVKPSYGMYKVTCDINDVAYREAELSSDFELEAAKVLEKADANTKLIFLCSPNNPSGNLFNVDEIEFILNTFNGIVIVDEAYVDFSKYKSWSNSLDKYPQLIVIQTFSKSFGLAGIRLGISWSSTEIVTVLNNIKPPYNVNQLTIDCALEKIRNRSEIEKNISDILNQKELLKAELKKLNMVKKVFPSESNFFLVRFENAKKVYDFLINKGVVVRDRSTQFNCSNCLRITVGAEKENNQLIELLKIYSNEKSTIYR